MKAKFDWTDDLRTRAADAVRAGTHAALAQQLGIDRTTVLHHARLAEAAGLVDPLPRRKSGKPRGAVYRKHLYAAACATLADGGNAADLAAAAGIGKPCARYWMRRARGAAGRHRGSLDNTAAVVLARRRHPDALLLDDVASELVYPDGTRRMAPPALWRDFEIDYIRRTPPVVMRLKSLGAPRILGPQTGAHRRPAGPRHDTIARAQAGLAAAAAGHSVERLVRTFKVTKRTAQRWRRAAKAAAQRDSGPNRHI